MPSTKVVTLCFHPQCPALSLVYNFLMLGNLIDSSPNLRSKLRVRDHDSDTTRKHPYAVRERLRRSRRTSMRRFDEALRRVLLEVTPAYACSGINSIEPLHIVKLMHGSINLCLSLLPGPNERYHSLIQKGTSRSSSTLSQMATSEESVCPSLSRTQFQKRP